MKENLQDTEQLWVLIISFFLSFNSFDTYNAQRFSYREQFHVSITCSWLFQAWVSAGWHESTSVIYFYIYKVLWENATVSILHGAIF